MSISIEVKGAIILSAHNRYEPFIGTVGIEGERIAYVKDGVCGTSARKTIDGQGKILMPGLVNGHCHGDMTLARGLGDDLTLKEQNEAFGGCKWFYDYIKDIDRYKSRQLTYLEALLSGTTFIAENMYWSLGDDSARAMAETGISGALVEDIRKDYTDSEGLMSDTQLAQLKKAAFDNGLIPVIGSISEEDFDADLLCKIKRIVDRLDILQTFHCAETKWRLKIIEDKFATTPIEFLHRSGVLSGNVIGSHSVYITEDEMKLMSYANMKVVNTPLCEMKIADGIAPIPQFLKNNITVGLGTDGAMWNNSNDIFREMKCMSLLHTINGGIRTIGSHDIMDMATINGAKVFNMDGEIGTIEEGKRADFILVDACSPHMNPLRLGKYENVCSSIVFSATGRDVTDVIIRGRHIVENRNITTMEVSPIIAHINEVSAYIAEKLEKERT